MVFTTYCMKFIIKGLKIRQIMISHKYKMYMLINWRACKMLKVAQRRIHVPQIHRIKNAEMNLQIEAKLALFYRDVREIIPPSTRQYLFACAWTRILGIAISYLQLTVL